MEQSTSVMGKNKTVSSLERLMNMLFFVCGITAMICVICMTLYMIICGWPAIEKIGEDVILVKL